MQATHYIAAAEFCSSHQVELTFIHELQQNDLLELSAEGQELLISEEQISVLEKIVRLHFDLEINLEGIAAILPLLERVESLQREMTALRNKLGRYEDI